MQSVSVPATLRAPERVMDLRRLGSLYQYPLSFMRIVVRHMMRERWRITAPRFDLDELGNGVAIYQIETPSEVFSFVVFTNDVDPAYRVDRVIAEVWDMTVTLCAGPVDAARLRRLSENVPRQEKGRFDSRCIVLSRANKSMRNFQYVVDTLSAGAQPELAQMARVGYLYRTTAVYGSGKFGMADWERVRTRYPDLSTPFAAEMLTCYLIRQFSLDQADYLARRRAPETAVAMDEKIKRYMGIGNATGLGMAPYLITHPLLIDRWVSVRETALARVLTQTEVQPDSLARLDKLLSRAATHLAQTETGSPPQNALNKLIREEVLTCQRWLAQHGHSLAGWPALCTHAQKHYDVETQELLNSLLMELYPELIEDLESSLSVSQEQYPLQAQMPLSRLRELIEQRYAWALAFDFSSAHEQAVFWYQSEDKMEPRLGDRAVEPGVRRELGMGVARAVQACYQTLLHSTHALPSTVGEFVCTHSEHRATVCRIQTMANTPYGDIQSNLLSADVLPTQLLRCKLSFFGVGKFDPQSRLWVRNTMFQGAPISSDIGQPFEDDWYFPVAPTGSAAPCAGDAERTDEDGEVQHRASVNELQGLLSRAFKALYGQGCDSAECAAMVLWLQRHGLGGVETLAAMLPALEQDPTCGLVLSESDRRHATLDVRGSNVWLALCAATDLAIAKASADEAVQLRIARLAAVPMGIVPGAARCAAAGLFVFAEWYDVWQPGRYHRVTATPQHSHPHYEQFDLAPPAKPATTDEGQQPDMLTLWCTANAKQYRAALAKGVDVSRAQAHREWLPEWLQQYAQQSARWGVSVPRPHYDALTNVAARLLVPNSEQSYRSAG